MKVGVSLFFQNFYDWERYEARGFDRPADTSDAQIYDEEIRPSWEQLSENERAARLEGFIELAAMLDASAGDSGLPEEMSAVVHTKTLLLAWAFDETYGYLGRLVRGETAPPGG